MTYKIQSRIRKRMAEKLDRFWNRIYPQLYYLLVIAGIGLVVYAGFTGKFASDYTEIHLWEAAAVFAVGLFFIWQTLFMDDRNSESDEIQNYLDNLILVPSDDREAANYLKYVVIPEDLVKNYFEDDDDLEDNAWNDYDVDDKAILLVV